MHCDEPLDDSARAAVHISGRYRCQSGDGWAEPAEGGPLKAALDEAYAEGYREGEEELDRDVESAYDDGVREGRKQLVRDIRGILDNDGKPGDILEAIDNLIGSK